MSVYSPETVAGMGDLAGKHGVKFGFIRVHQSPTESGWTCLVTDSVGSVVGEGTGHDRDEAFADASHSIDFSAIGRTPAQMAAELRDLRKRVASPTTIGNAVKVAESPKVKTKDFPATS